ncbi:MAG: 1,2-phenylacetyl-CoA epoxidase subunit B [Ectothiorhodospiraceae bacterium]|nr:1,2-phenylacetyl-CoA epoxidase subunit B [Ectothiorhodospiraceae bacterium]
MPEYKFNPYHQRIDEAIEKAQAPFDENDTQWPEWEVFVQEKRGDCHEWVGSVHAPDPEMALLMAKESFIRRQPCVNLWIVKQDDVHATSYQDADMFAPAFDRKYRLAAGFKLNKPASVEEDD